jgi:predicted acyl esterase
MVPYDKELAQINIPVLTTTGYYGVGAAGALYYFNEQRRLDPNANHTLLVGPYDDGASQHGVQGILKGYAIDPAAFVDLRDLRYQWFDSVFKGAPVPALLKDRVNYEVMGANEWRHVPSIEAMGNAKLQWTLDSARVGASHRLTPHEMAEVGAVKSDAGRAKAKPKPPVKGKHKGKPADPGYVELTVNLADRHDIDSHWVPYPDIVSRTADVRDATAYVSTPLSAPMELQGVWSGSLDLTINKSDVDLRLTAYELLATGEYVQLFEPYVLRASYAQDRVTRHPLKPGERQKIEFKIERLTSRRLQAGSRLVFVLGVNKRPDQEINYGSGGDVAGESLTDEGSKVPVKIRWWNDSYIETAVMR